jgi:hypothetical protein
MALDVTEGRKAQQALQHRSRSCGRPGLPPASIAIDQAGTSSIAVARVCCRNAGTSAGTCDGAELPDVTARSVTAG